MQHRSCWAEVAVDAVAELVVVIDGLGRVVYGNRRAESLLGFRLEDWIGVSGIDLVHPDDIAMAAERIVSAQATGIGVKEPVLYRFRCADETWLEIEEQLHGFERNGGFEGPCELLVAAGVR